MGSETMSYQLLCWDCQRPITEEEGVGVPTNPGRAVAQFLERITTEAVALAHDAQSVMEQIEADGEGT